MKLCMFAVDVQIAKLPVDNMNNSGSRIARRAHFESNMNGFLNSLSFLVVYLYFTENRDDKKK